MTLHCSVVTTFEALERLAPAWLELLERSASNEPSLSPLWALAWWRVFGISGGRKLRVAVIREDERIVGIAPLLCRWCLGRPYVPLRRLEPIGTGEDEMDEVGSEYLGIVAERGAEVRVVNAFADALVGGVLGAWDEILIPSMDGTSPVVAEVGRSLEGRGILVEVAETGAAPYVALGETWESYIGSLPPGHRYLVTRSIRDFLRWAGGTAEMRAAETWEEVAEAKKILLSLHGERWAEQREDGAFGSPRFTAFHDAVLPALFERGALELLVLRARSEPVAALYNIVWNGKVHFYQGGRKIDLPRTIRPGIVLHAWAIRRAIEAGRREYDFLGGAARYKVQLAPLRRPLITVRALRPSLRAGLRSVAQRGIETAARARALVCRRIAAESTKTKKEGAQEGETG